MIRGYEIVTLCGSARFKDDFIRIQEKLTLQGKIVISVGIFGHADNKFAPNLSVNKTDERAINPDTDLNDLTDPGTYSYRTDVVITDSVKEMLDDMHKGKIDISDSIFVINKNGYIGKSTQSQIEYAKKSGKRIEYMEPFSSISRYWSNLSQCPSCNTSIPWDMAKSKGEYQCVCGASFKCCYGDPTTTSIFGNPWYVTWTIPDADGRMMYLSTETLNRSITVIRYL